MDILKGMSPRRGARIFSFFIFFPLSPPLLNKPVSLGIPWRRACFIIAKYGILWYSLGEKRAVRDVAN